MQFQCLGSATTRVQRLSSLLVSRPACFDNNRFLRCSQQNRTASNAIRSPFPSAQQQPLDRPEKRFSDGDHAETTEELGVIKNAVKPPTSQQLWRQFFNAAVPMVGFGFIDNFIMLQAGEILDTSIGVTFGLATLTAAAVGQIFSDVSGVAMGGIVQAVAGKHLPPSGLDPDQRRLGICRVVGTVGRMIGVIAGCLLGMSSLLFMDLEESQRLKRFRELQPILTTIIRHTKRLANVSTCRIYLLGVNEEGEEVLFEVGQTNNNNGSPKQQQQQPSSDPHQSAASPFPLFSSTSTTPSTSSNSFLGKDSSIRAFSHHFNRTSVNNRHPHENGHENGHGNGHGNGSSSHSSPSLPCHTTYLQCVRVAPSTTIGPTTIPSTTGATCSTSSINRTVEIHRQHEVATMASSAPPPAVEPVVRYVARTGEAVMCVRQNPKAVGTTDCRTSDGVAYPTSDAEIPHEWIISSPYNDQLLLAATSPVNNSVLCYPVFDDMDRDRVIGVIELADKVASSPTDVGTFTREDERLVRMLSEHLSLYLAMTNYRNANVSEEVESVEKIGYVCPEDDFKKNNNHNNNNNNCYTSSASSPPSSCEVAS